MSLFQNAITTYDAMQHLAGLEVEVGEILAPIGFVTRTANIEITIDKNANFIRAQNIEKKVLIPVTESSAGRSGKSPAAHPLCDKVEYMDTKNKDKFDKYISLLGRWAESEHATPKVKAIYEYVKKGDVINDLLKNNIVSINDKGEVKKADRTVTWKVEGTGEETDDVAFDKNLQSAFYHFYKDEISDRKNEICMITGNTSIPAVQHLKGVLSSSGNAKLISSNDTTEFTYRGRFADSDEAASISYEASQKAHNALKWLVSNQRVLLGDNNTDRRLICWNPHGLSVPNEITSPLYQSENKEKEKATPANYQEILNKVLYGYEKSLPARENVVIAIFEAATSGRLSVIYYNDLQSSDFLDRLKSWDESCCWYNNKFGVSSPSLYQIVECAYGIQRGDKEDSKLEVNGKLKSKQLMMLISCKIDKRPIPTSLIKSITQKASNLQILNNKNRLNTLFTACAVIKKYREDKYKEVWKMSLEKDKKDKSYQYGRLLAVLEKIERDAFGSEGKRTTNALRAQAAFVQRPGKISEQLITHLRVSCYPKLSFASKIYYDKLIGEIIEKIAENEDNKKSLSETYILGYYLQNNELYKKREEN